MPNIYHADLSLPIPFIPQFAQSDLYTRPYKIESSEPIVQWLNSIGLEIARAGAELFYTPPDRSIPIHADGITLDNKVKLNFQYGGAGSEMKWYQRSSGAAESTVPGQFGRYITVPAAQATQVWSARIGQPSLINAGVLHNITNGHEPRWVVSIPLWDVAANRNLQWDDAVEKFRSWLL